VEAHETDFEQRLAVANERLSRLLKMKTLPLVRGGSRALDDSLWIWGVLGGKEVGKSTLVDALAGEDVTAGRDRSVEGTYQPQAYLNAEDVSRAMSRFGNMQTCSVEMSADAPAGMKGLVLVDLPDFDSTFSDHAETVREVAGSLDGIIWITTPKKVGDLRAMDEINRVLKSPTNFIFVVNKIDWLVAQSDRPADVEVERVLGALRSQASACGAEPDDASVLAVSAKHPTSDAFLASVEQLRGGRGSETGLPSDSGSSEAGSSSGGPLGAVVLDASLREVAELMAGQFETLRTRLTTAPSVDASLANKRANLSYQATVQAGDLLDHYQPRSILERLRRDADEATVGDIVEGSFPARYVVGVMNRLTDDDGLFMRWSLDLFKRRVAYWPVLGVIAWPVVMLLASLRSLKRYWPAERSVTMDDPFSMDGVSLDTRAEAVVAGVRARLASIDHRVAMNWPASGDISQQFRSQSVELADARQDMAIARYMNRSPGFVGRGIRWVVPLAILIWFPVAQPVLSIVLNQAVVGVGLNLETVGHIVTILSAQSVLVGLSASLLALAGLVAIIYARAVGDTFRGLDALRSASAGDLTSALSGVVATIIRQPIADFDDKLDREVRVLESYAPRTLAA
jgi:hypothetical protein